MSDQDQLEHYVGVVDLAIQDLTGLPVDATTDEVREAWDQVSREIRGLDARVDDVAQALMDAAEEREET